MADRPYRRRDEVIIVSVPTRRRDWFRILRDLVAKGISMSAIARKCNHDVCTVRNWADGGEPKESDARIVLAMYARYCPAQYRRTQMEYQIAFPYGDFAEAGEPEDDDQPGASSDASARAAERLLRLDDPPKT